MKRGALSPEEDYWLCVPVPPLTNTRYGRGTGRSPFYVKRSNKKYQQLIKETCLAENIRPIDGDVAVSIRWYRSSRRGDVPDRWKDLMDALQAGKDGKVGAYYNDSQIADFHVRRLDTEPKKARVVVHISKYRGDS